MTRPQLWLLAGGNGSGKSTFYREFLEKHQLPFVNADQIAKQLKPQDTQQISYQAARVAGRIRNELLQQQQSFCFETVFSHPSKIDFVAQAKALDYEVILIFIHLDNVELNKARVQQRVSEGGHPVPEAKIQSRIPRSLQHMRDVIALCDRVELLDNSSYEAPFRQLVSIINGETTLHVEPLPAWAENILTLQ